MKKTAAILLLGIFAFNWVGYRLVTAYLEDRTNAQFDAGLDANRYDDADLISIKVANNLPYTNNKDYQRVSGQIEIAGIQYNYVKMKVTSDYIEFLCIPNQALTQMKSSRAEYFKLVNDLQHNGQQKKGDNHPGASKNFSTDSYTMQGLLQFALAAASASGTDFHPYDFLIPSSHVPVAEQPPEIA